MAVNWKPVGLLLVGALVVQVMVLHLMGQPAICACGSVRLWAGTVLGPENSQQITDWYTPSHVIHGLLFYALGWLLLRGRSPLLALPLALGIEIGWELVENSPLVIDRYREQALAQGYSGDSILNSLCDTTAMLIGYWLASRLPVRASVALALIAELFTAVMIRDNLTLNVIMLVWPMEAIKTWQGGL